MIVKGLIVCLNSQLFGEDDPDEDVSPDTADPEAAGV
jgi:ubiquitin-like 1-activating enzyme E1 B